MSIQNPPDPDPFGDIVEVQTNVNPLTVNPTITAEIPYDLVAHCRKAQALSEKITNNTSPYENIIQSQKEVMAEARHLVAYAKEHNIEISVGVPGVLSRIRSHQQTYVSSSLSSGSDA